MKKNQSWSALLIGIFITTIIVIIAIYLLEKIIPFSRDIKGVENGNISYYRANTALNEALLSMSGSDPSLEPSSSAPATLSSGSGYVYNVTAMGQIIPAPGQGNSEYNTNWSIIAPGKPIQLVLSSGITWTDVTNTYFTFRVPDLDKTKIETLTGSLGIDTPIINWILTASGESLQASGSQIVANKIFSGSVIVLNGRQWLTLSSSPYTFDGFYWAPGNKCTWSDICTLKLSLINPLLLTSGESAPYLEYQAHFNVQIPLQTAVIETQGYAGGFRKNITRFIQQMTTNEALDFTVFQ